jgi:DNA-binding NarL/FixJ family response regulator
LTEAWGGAIPHNGIVVVGNHPEVLDALADLIGEEPGLHLIAATRDGMEAIALAGLHRPEVLLVDMQATNISAALIARDVHLVDPSVRLVALSSDDDPASVRRSLEAGFHRHVSKQSGIADLLTILLEDHVCIA